MASPHLRIAILVTLFTFPTSTFQWCYEDEEFQEEMSKEGYSWCTPQYDLLYVKGFQRTRGTDDLRDFRKVKCCQPPELHLEIPYTCTSADWDMSFSRWVFRVTSGWLFLISFGASVYCFFFSFKKTLLNLNLYAKKNRSTCKVLRKLSYNA